LFEHDLFGKPLRPFPDHALAGHADWQPALHLVQFRRTGSRSSAAAELRGPSVSAL